MHTLILGLLLLGIVSFLLPVVQYGLRGALQARPALLFAVPISLTLLFCCLAAANGAFSISLALLVLAYTGAPSLAAFAQGACLVKRPSWLDFVIILMLWLPLEFAAGARL